jgi:uncharacterized protein (TIRG00374 family)
LVISIAAIILVYYIVDWERFFKALKLADYRIIIVAIGVSVLWLVVRAIAWRTLLREQATFSQVFFTVNEGYLLNNILPFRLGEIGRAFILSRKASIGFWEVFSSIIIERILDLAIAVSVLLITIPFIVGADWALQAAFGVGTLVIIGFLLLYLLARKRESAIKHFNLLSEKWPILNKFGSERVEAFFNGLAVLTDGKRFLKAIFWMLTDWGIAIIQYFLILLAFYPTGKILWSIFSLSGAALGMAAPSSPGAVGVFELSIVAALSVFGIEASIALAIAIAAHLIQFLVTGLLGAIGFIRDGESLLGIYRRSSEIPQKLS